MILRSGIDLIEPVRFENMDPGVRERFLYRVFTPAEQQLCGDNAQRIAGRFACKEAVSKALGTGFGKVHWTDVEILSGPEGEPLLILHGEAKRIAEKTGLTLWSVSITHIKEAAAAIATAMSEP